MRGADRLRTTVEIVADRAALDACARRLAAEIDRDHPDGVVLVGILRGAVFTLADVARHLTVPTLVDFLAVSSYAEGTGRVRLLKDLDLDVGGRDVVLVEDVVDTGLTLSYVHRVLSTRHPRRIRVCAMLDRRATRLVPIAVDYAGLEVDDTYAVGYGLDHEGRYRNVHAVARTDAAALRADPDALVGRLYGGAGAHPDPAGGGTAES